MDKIINNSELSEFNFIEKSFTELFDIQGGTQPPKSLFIYEPKEGYVRLLQIRDFGENPVPTYIPLTRNLKLCSKDDILIGRYGASVGRICTGMEGAYNVALTRVVPHQHMHQKYIYYLLNSHYFQDQLRNIERSAQNGFNKDDLADIYLPAIEDFEIQVAISQRLDTLTTNIVDARKRVVKARRLIKKFKQAILSAAIIGKLTEEWREANPQKPTKEVVEDLKERLLKQNVTAASKNKIEAIFAYKEQNNNDDLPADWNYIALNKLCDGFQYGTSTKSSAEGEVPVLRMGNLQNGEVDWSDLVYTSDPREIEKYKLKAGDVLFNRTNSPELVGKTSIYRGEQPAIYAGYLIKINNYPDLDSEYLNYCLNSQYARDFCYQVKTDGVSQSNINAQKLGKFEIPFCSLAEQEEIVKRVKYYFDIANQVEKQIEKAEMKVGKLTQAILAKTFAQE